MKTKTARKSEPKTGRARTKSVLGWIALGLTVAAGAFMVGFKQKADEPVFKPDDDDHSLFDQPKHAAMSVVSDHR